MPAASGGTLLTSDKHGFPPLEGKLNLSKDAVSGALIVVFCSSYSASSSYSSSSSVVVSFSFFFVLSEFFLSCFFFTAAGAEI